MLFEYFLNWMTAQIPSISGSPSALAGSSADSTLLPGNDIAALFAYFGRASQAHSYRELVRDDTALAAADRWPLLAEIENLAAVPAGD
ncbi:BcsR/BcsP family cellulose biosynthesis protein [Leptospira sp. SA-E8]|uniref:BcsR/BcsP family cellulose biosynthesis protein n=1 Tax=Leptospira sp. SA-E8 TaxID=3422259 RepID=UPI003EB75B5F